jgi:hypothetical protein
MLDTAAPQDVKKKADVNPVLPSVMSNIQTAFDMMNLTGTPQQQQPASQNENLAAIRKASEAQVTQLKALIDLITPALTVSPSVGNQVTKRVGQTDIQTKQDQPS